MSKIEVDKIDPQSGTDLELGTSGDTITIPTGVTLDASNATTTLPATVVTTDGTQTLTNKSIDASQLTGTITPSDNTVSLAKLTATGTKDATTFLRGDNTFAAAGLNGWSEDGANNNLLPASASAGIYLGVNSATASNLLDDYEEGSFTPTLSSGTASTQEGFYTKVGNAVAFTLRLANFSDRTSSTAIEITLPFTSTTTSGQQSYVTVMSRYINIGDKSLTGYVGNNTNKLFVYQNGNNNDDWVQLRHSKVPNTSANVRLTGIMYVN